MTSSRAILAIFIISCAPNWACGDESDGPLCEESHQSRVKHEFNVLPDGDPLLIPVQFDGRELLFVVDSGSPFHVLDSRELPTKPAAYTTAQANVVGGKLAIFDEDDLKSADVPALKIGGEVLTYHALAFADLEGPRRALDRPVAGVLGIEFFGDRIVQIDFDRGLLRLMDWRTPRDEAWGVEVSLMVDKKNRRALVNGILLGDRKVSAVLDTGSVGVLSIEPATFNALADGHQLQRGDATKVMRMDGISEESTGYLHRIKVGPYEHQQLRVFGSDGGSNLLGLGYLRRYCVTIDLAGSRMFLAPGKHFDDVDNSRPVSGLNLLRINRQIVVNSVDDGSPAGKAGVRAGDIVLEINGNPAESIDLLKIRREREIGAEVNLKLRRDDEDVQARYNLKEY